MCAPLVHHFCQNTHETVARESEFMGLGISKKQKTFLSFLGLSLLLWKYGATLKPTELSFGIEKEALLGTSICGDWVNWRRTGKDESICNPIFPDRRANTVYGLKLIRTQNVACFHEASVAPHQQPLICFKIGPIYNSKRKSWVLGLTRNLVVATCYGVLWCLSLLESKRTV